MPQRLKRFLKLPVAGVLGMLARRVVNKYKPTVVMVTGSVGKTSTKDAVAAVLASKYNLRKSVKSLNSEFGVPFTILGVDNPWKDVFGWLHLFSAALALIFLPNQYPKMLVLEVGADWPGDLDRILKIVKPDAVVVTLLPDVPVHVEAYETPAAVREEEFAPALALPAGAPLIISADDEHAEYRSRSLNVKLTTFGTNANADVRVRYVQALEENKILCGMKGELVVEGRAHPIQIKDTFGASALLAPASALATAIAFGMTVEEALKALTSYESPPGRGRILKGINDSILIDDTYNASPIAVEEILKSLELIPHGMRHIAVLGDMLELGRYSVNEHTRVGRIAQETADIIVTVGQRARAIGEAAQLDGMSEELIHDCATSEDAIKLLEKIVQPGDIVLIKASQGIRLERVVKALLANPDDAQYLVRQDKAWQKR